MQVRGRFRQSPDAGPAPPSHVEQPRKSLVYIALLIRCAHPGLKSRAGQELRACLRQSGFACLQFSTQGLRTWVAARVRSKDLTYQVFRPTGWFVAAMAESYSWRARYSRSLFLRGGMRDNFELQVTGAPLESHELRAGLRQRGCELLLHSLTQGLRTWANKNSALRAGSSKQWLNHIPEKQQSGNRSGNSPGKRF